MPLIITDSFAIMNNYNCENVFDIYRIPRVAITKDNSTIVMYHPQSTIKYEDTIPIPRDDPRYSAHENVESLVRYDGIVFMYY